ncbi:MAG: hypothetical protein ACR2GZ_05495 [Solirubrobacteraceae bacterium]
MSELKRVKRHGHPVNCVEPGTRPVLLVHGMAGEYRNCEPVITPLAEPAPFDAETWRARRRQSAGDPGRPA